MEDSRPVSTKSNNRAWYLFLLVFTATAVLLPLFGNISRYGYILLPLLLALFIEYIALVWFVPSTTTRIKMAAYLAVLLVALVFLAAKPLFSTDVYRYVWDGGLSVHGINPYTIKPVDVTEPALLQSGLLAHQGYPNEYTIYPPLAEGIFAVSYGAYDFFGLIGAKLIFALPLFLLWILMRTYLSPKFHMLFILNPLLLFEAFNGAHIDLWAVLFLVSTWYFLNKKYYTLSALTLAAAVLTKIYPILFLPLFAWHIYKNSSIRRAVSFCLLCGGVVALVYLPLFAHFGFIVERYRAWINDMQFNAGLYSFIKIIFSYVVHNPVVWAQRVSATCMVILIALLMRLRLSATVMLATAIVFLSFSSVVYPWYTAVLVPFVFLIANGSRSSAPLYSLVFFQFLVTTTYINEVILAMSGHVSSIIGIISIIEYLFLYAAIAWHLFGVSRKNLTSS